MLLIGCLIGISAVHAQSPVPGGRELKVGDKFKYDLGPVFDMHEIKSFTDTHIVVDSTVFGTLNVPKSFNGAWSWTGGQNTGGYSEEFNPPPQSLLPLAAGKRVQAWGTGKSGRFTFTLGKTCSVAAQYQLAVPAGNFEVIPIRCEHKILAGDTSTRVYYYAPVLGYWAQYQTQAQAKLVEFTPAP